MEKIDSNGSSNSPAGSARDGALGKLLPKSISDKRRRRKEQKARELEGGDGKLTRSSSSMMLSSDDGTNSASNMADDDERSLDGRSFGSFESGPEPESGNGSARSSLRNTSRYVVLLFLFLCWCGHVSCLRLHFLFVSGVIVLDMSSHFYVPAPVRPQGEMSISRLLELPKLHVACERKLRLIHAETNPA